jgi:hypothetical protein
LSTTQATTVRVLYLHGRLGVLDPVVRVVNVTPLGRELVLRAVAAAPDARRRGGGRAPAPPRAVAITDAILAPPASG